MLQATSRVVAMAFALGKAHNFAAFKASPLPLARTMRVQADIGYLGVFHLPHRPYTSHTKRPGLGFNLLAVLYNAHL